MSLTIASMGAVLRSQLGVVEQHENLTAYGKWFGMDGVAWCDILQSWAAFQAGGQEGLDACGGKQSFTPTHAAFYRNAGRWSRVPQIGAQSFHHWPGKLNRIAHVGWVESVGDGWWIAIEGNTDIKGGRTGGRVMRQKRTLASLGATGGFGMPKYAGVGAAAPTATVGVPRCPGVSREGMGRKGAPDPIVTAYQQRFKDRGWSVVVDGIHREGFSRVIRAFQLEKHLTLDRGTPAAGPQVWGALWSAPVTR